MVLSQIVKPQCIIVPLSAPDKETAITQLVDVLNDSKLLLNRNDVLEAVLTREKTRSTGIGSGIAIPHGKCNAVKELVMAIGITKEDIDFASVDGKGVKIILLLVSPASQTGPHIQALAKISRLMLDEQFRNEIASVESADKVYQLLSDKESL